MKVSLPCKLGNADAGVEALLDDPKLLGRRPAPPPLRTRQNRNGHYACPLTCQLMRARSHIRCQSGRRGSPDAYALSCNSLLLLSKIAVGFSDCFINWCLPLLSGEFTFSLHPILQTIRAPSG